LTLKVVDLLLLAAIRLIIDYLEMIVNIPIIQPGAITKSVKILDKNTKKDINLI